MMFSSRELNAALWAPRAGEDEFAIGTGYLISGGPNASAIAVEPAVPASAPTLTIDLVAGPYNFSRDFQLGMWISAGPSPSPSDVACRIVGMGTAEPTIAITGPNPTTSAAGPTALDNAFFMRVILEPTRAGTNIVCAAAYNDPPVYIYTRGHIDPPLGSFGFTALYSPSVITQVIIYERDDTPPLP